ncbi:MAG: response regulator transcription factor [Candidatus Omnitrophica bacterium]|nr:response regulator transcription factor [Candidatus Omnitrophota bacterium]
MHKILIVEDDVDLATVLQMNLVSKGFEVFVAHDAIQGTSLAHNKNPDLIILDINLPAGGGLAILRNVKMSINTKLIPVIILSGTEDEQLIHEVLHGGVEDYIKKPYDLEDLCKRINHILHATE